MTDTPAEVAEAMYPPVDVLRIAGLYARHVNAMTVEGLHDKSDIAAQLAARDAHIADLERQLAEAREARQKWYDRYQQQNENWLAAERQIADLQSQLAAQRERDGRDAARYRWLRDLPSLAAEKSIGAIGGEGVCMLQRERLDAAIDAALKGG